MTAQTEASFQSAVVDLARITGWKTMHVRRTIGRGTRWTTGTSLAGWPDLALWRLDRFILAELKTDTGRVTDDQADVLDSLQPADRSTLQRYDVDPAVLRRWRQARTEYLSARAALVGAIEKQGWRPPTPADHGDYIDVVFTASPGGPDEPPAEFVEVEDDQGNSIRMGEWMRRDDGSSWVLRLPRGEATR